jgi:hypothetical protein
MDYAVELMQWLEGKFTGWFAQPNVATALFSGASAVRVDLTRQAVSWRTISGDSGLRPFDAFSSGEQAFAYTRAQLEALGPLTARNRLIALDEFAAFVAHDRRDDLRRLLLERSERFGAEKTVIILPVTQDYASLANAAVGAMAERYTRRAEALKASDGYFAEEFKV